MQEVIDKRAPAAVASNGSQPLVADTSVKVLDHNDSRAGFTITNDGATAAWLSYGPADAVVHAGGFVPADGGVWTDDDWPGEVHAISSGITNLCVIEKSYASGDDEGQEPAGAAAFTPSGPGDAPISPTAPPPGTPFP